MAIKLQIRKKAGNVWDYHNTDTGITQQSSRQFVHTIGDSVRFEHPFGNKFSENILSEIAIYDDTDGGTEEVFATIPLFSARLKELKNPSYSQDCDGDVNGGTL